MKSMKQCVWLASVLVGLAVVPGVWAEEAGIGDWGVNDATYGLKTREAEVDFTYTPSPADWRDINIYQLFTDRFADSGTDQLAGYKPGWKTEGKAFPQNRNFHHGGDWKGMQQNIGYLTGMGVKAVWMSGVQMNDQGKDLNYTPYHQYHPENFFKCDPAMGTFQDLKELIDALHAAGIYVILDVAPNHMCDKNGLWGNNQQDDKQYFANGNSTFDWWDQNNKHPAPFDNLAYFHNNGTINNWDSSPENLWGQFKGTDDLKTEDPAVQAILTKAFKNLIDATDCDGFRVDAIKHMEYNWNKQWADDMRKHAAYRGKNDFILFGELFSYDNNALASWCKDAGYSYNSALFFPLSQTIKNVFVDNGWAGQLTQQLNNKGQYGEGADRLVAFIDNHDLNRIALMNGGDTGNDVYTLRPALSFLYLATPVPCLYYGTEHAFDQGGHYNGSNKTEDNPDDGDWQRETMFDKGFQPGPAQGNKLAATDAPLYQHIAALNAARATHLSLTRGSLQERYVDGAYAFSRVYDEEEALVAINLQDGNKSLDPQVSKPNGTEFVNALNPADSLTVSDGKLSISLSAKETKIYVAGVAAPTLWARGTHTYPAAGEVTSDTAIYINAEAGPASTVTNVLLGYSLDGGATWETPMAMTLNTEWSSEGGAWYNATLGLLPADTAVQYFIQVQGTEDTEAVDNNNGQNYRFTVAQGLESGLWIRGTKNYPEDGSATFATEVYVDTEVGPAGSVSNVSVVVSSDGSTWTTNAMTLNPEWGSSGGAWYNATLGTFAEGTVVRYFITATDGEETIVADNGGLVFQVTIRGAGLAITTPAGSTAVANGIATTTLAGTASAVTTGNLRWTNALTGASGTIPAATPWTIADIPLGVGANVISVFGETAGGGTDTQQDRADNYGSGWSDGSNLGSGFGAWSFNHAQNGTNSWAGSFIGDPTGAGISGMGTNAFGFYANPAGVGANAEVLRSFSSAMTVGSTFSFKLGLNFDSDEETSYRGFVLFAGDTELANLSMGNSASIMLNGGAMFTNYGAQAMALNVEYTGDGSLRIWGTGRDGVETYDQTRSVAPGAPTRFKFYFNGATRLLEPPGQEDHRQMYVDDLTLTGPGAGETLSAQVTITRQEPVTDSNGDGVPDAWLAGHGRDPSTSGAALAPNGYTYLESYLMDLDPDDDTLPAFLMEPGTTSAFTFDAPEGGRRYRVQYTSNLFLPFGDIGPGVEVGQAIEINTDPAGFYRVRFYDEAGETETVTVSATPSSTTFTNAAGVAVTLNVSGDNVITATYALAGSPPAAFTNGQVVTIGAGWTNEQTALLTLYGETAHGATANRAYGYTYTDAAQLELTSVGGTHHWVSDDNQVFINAAGYPEGSTVSAHIIYAVNPVQGDTNAWPLIAMERIPDWVNGDWWNNDLGILNTGDVVQFAIVMSDAFGNEIWDNNGGANYSVTIGPVAPPTQGGEKPYSTNPSFGKRQTMTIDGSPSEWTTNHLIAIDMANDDPRSLGDNWTMHEPPIDATHLWAAWDDDNLYLAWQFVDVTDIIDPANAGGAGSGKIGNNDGILQWLVLDTITGQGATTDVWGKKNTWAGPNKPNYQIYLAGSLWQGYISRAVDGAFALDDGGTNYNLIAAAGITVAQGAVCGADSLWGVDDADNRHDAGAPTRDFLTQGHDTSRDSFYEMSIPLSYLEVTAAQLDSGAGIGVMLGAGSESAMDSIPHDETTLDTPGVESYNSSFEWSDADIFTVPFARVGK
ncbi:MAG: alpha-amylase family glycosyl hydrolase [Kiritimatiellae bacterium]|nr:alpha-amylase family glycosyl hydrolase [Kiritimatiellia bacterium]